MCAFPRNVERRGLDSLNRPVRLVELVETAGPRFHPDSRNVGRPDGQLGRAPTTARVRCTPPAPRAIDPDVPSSMWHANGATWTRFRTDSAGTVDYRGCLGEGPKGP